MTVRFYSSIAPETTLSAGISNASTSIQVGSATGYPTNTPFTIAVDYEGAAMELMQVESVALTTFTVTRGIDGTSAAAHNAGARVRHVSSARDFSDSRTHENADNGIHGLAPGDVLVGEDATQTLTNKTLVSPTLTSSTLNGTTNITGPANFTSSLTGGSSATLRNDNTNGLSLVSTNHAFQLGVSSGSNLRMDTNEIQSVNAGAPSTLGLNVVGGPIAIYTGLAADSLLNTVTVNGVVAANQVQSIRVSGTATGMSSRITGDTNSRWLVQADGANRWGPGNATADAGISRTAPGVLTVDNSMVIPQATITTASITNLLTPVVSAAGASVFTVASGWSLSSAQGVKINGMTTIVIGFQRTGATISAGADGNVPGDPQIGTIVAAYRPTALITQAMMGVVADGGGAGSVRINTDGTVDFLSWAPNGTITSGGGSVYRFQFSFPSV